MAVIYLRSPLFLRGGFWKYLFDLVRLMSVILSDCRRVIYKRGKVIWYSCLVAAPIIRNLLDPVIFLGRRAIISDIRYWLLTQKIKESRIKGPNLSKSPHETTKTHRLAKPFGSCSNISAAARDRKGKWGEIVGRRRGERWKKDRKRVGGGGTEWWERKWRRRWNGNYRKEDVGNAYPIVAVIFKWL